MIHCHLNQSLATMAVDQNAQKTLFDALYCVDEKWVELDDDDETDQQLLEEDNDHDGGITFNRNPLFPVVLLEQDLSWDDEELQSLLLKERETCLNLKDASLIHSLARKEAVEWILKINAHYGFSALTAILAVNYLDRFVSSMSFQPDKPWMMQLVAVACLSLAAKVEETCVPLLLDLQVEGAKYVFEAKTIQRMELMVLSTLKWRMNSLTPLSFVDHIIRRLGLKNCTHFEILTNCENLLLSVIYDSRLMRYLPSVIAAATMLHVIHQVIEPSNATDYENQLLGVLKICKEELDNCYNLITDKLITNYKKRTLCQVTNSPSGVMDACFSSDDSSNDSWEVLNGSCISSSSSSFHFNKKRRVREQQMKFPCRGFADAIASSPR